MDLRETPSMFRYRGLIELQRLGPAPAGPLPIECDADTRCLRLPGIELRWRAGDADVAADAQTLVLAAGRSRDTGNGAGGEASRWLNRYKAREEFAAEAVGGGFAVALVDFRRRRAMLLVDRFGIETLCYHADRGCLAFADAACDVPGASRRVDAQSLYDYLYFHVIPAPRTAYADVHRLAAAYRVIATATAVSAARYWEPAFDENDDRDLRGRMRQFVELLRQSVAEEADDPATACFLSGGTDSSAVAGMLTRVRGAPVAAYSIGFEAQGYDEMAYARIAARHFGLDHHEHYLTPDDLVSAIPRVAASLDQPFGNSSVLPAYYCALRAKEDGFGRMLAGDGGDELFAGNARYAMQKFFDAYETIPKGLRTRVLEPMATRWPSFRRVPGLRQLGGYVRHASVPLPDRLEAFNLLHRLDDEMLDPGFRACVDARIPLEEQRATWRAIGAGSLINRLLAYDWKYTLADNDLPKVRYATRLAGVSVGYPLLGRALTDFSLALPPRWKLKRFKLRWFFKEALRDFLPVEVLRKKKHGFGLPFGHWMLAHPGLRRLAEDSLDGIAKRGLIRPDFPRELMAVRVPQAPGYYGETAWLLMMLEQWLRAHDADIAYVGKPAVNQEPTGDRAASSPHPQSSIT